MEATMTNEEIAKKYSGLGSDGLLNIYDLMNLARQDEREKMTEEKVKGYLGGLGGKESALIVLNYLLRGGITDDDLRGLRLQWIVDEQHSASNRIFNSEEALEEYIAKKRQLFKENNPFYHVPLELEREKMQGVDCWVSWDEDYFGEHPNPKISDDEPAEWVAGQFDVGSCDMRTEVFESFATMLGIEQGQCKKFRIVEVGNE